MNNVDENKKLNLPKRKIEGLSSLGVILVLILIYLFLSLRKPGESVIMFDVFTKILDGQEVTEDELYDGIQSLFPGGDLHGVERTSLSLLGENQSQLGNITIEGKNIHTSGGLKDYVASNNADGHLKELLKNITENGFITEKAIELTSINGAIDLEKFNKFKELLRFLPDEYAKKLEEFASKDSLKLNVLVSFRYFDGGENSPTKINSTLGLVFNFWDPETKESVLMRREFIAKDNPMKVDYFKEFRISSFTNPEGELVANEKAFAFLQSIYKISNFETTNEAEIKFFKTFFEEVLPKLMGMES